MHTVNVDNLACPLDGERLESDGIQLRCSNGHAFDIARQGYINLLLVQHKRSKQPGDSKEMVRARAGFLNSGLYEPVACQLAELVGVQIATVDQACVVDAGCGEGYYLDYIFRFLKDKAGLGSVSFIGLDISKSAVAEAAKRNRKISWVVGTNRIPPVRAASVDVVSCVFGFQSFDGFEKILKAGGSIILVEPGPAHLKELRQMIYTALRTSDDSDVSGAKAEGFSVVDRRQLQFRTGIMTNAQIQDLLLMTPHFFRATRQGRQAASDAKALDLTVDVVFTVLQKL